MIRTNIAPAIVAGVVSAALFLAVVALGLGTFFLFWPTLPLFYLGLCNKPAAAFYASITASIIIIAATGLAAALLFLAVFALPTCYVTRRALWWRQSGSEREWFPLGLVALNLTLMACALVAAIVLYYAFSGQSITQLIAAQIHNAFNDVEGDFSEVIDTLAGRMSFLVFAVSIWLWVGGLYVHGWIVQKMLIKTGKNLRPDFAMKIFIPPNWLLSLLLIAALAALVGSESMKFLGNVTIIALMLPYFLLGAALMHETSKSWPSRRFFLFFIYFSTTLLFWPALLLATVGVLYHIKRLSAPTSSSKN